MRLAPELADRLPGAVAPPVDDADSAISRFGLFDALVALLRVRSARGPVVVLIDDLQAVDEGSLVALDFVSRMLRDAAVLLVVTMHERVPERGADAQIALQNIVRSGRRLVLGGLTREDVGRLIELTSGVPARAALVDAVHAVTEGNPFFAREVLALLLAEGRLDDPPDELPLPDGVRETIRRRLEPLGDQQLDTLELAAIIGRTFTLATLEHASRLDRDVVLEALDEAAALGLVVAVPGTLGEYRFGHGLIRETLFAGMPVAVRMSGHRVVGEALETVYRGAIEAHLPELAHHFLSAAPRGDIAKAVDYAERAAYRALDTLAYEQAAELFARALEALERMDIDIPRRAGLLLGLGTAQSRAGRPASRASFEAAVAAARAIDAEDILCRAALGFAPFALTPGYVDEAHVALLVEALERIGPADDPMRVRLLGSLAVALYWSDQVARRAELADEALAMARRLGDEATLAIALSSAQLATCGPRLQRAGPGVAARALRADRAHGRDGDVARRAQPAHRRPARARRHRGRRHGRRGARAARARGARSARRGVRRAAPRAPRRVRGPPGGRPPPARRGRRHRRRAVVLDGPDHRRLAGRDPHVAAVRRPRDQRVARAYAAASPAMPAWRAALAAALADDGPPRGGPPGVRPPLRRRLRGAPARQPLVRRDGDADRRRRRPRPARARRWRCTPSSRRSPGATSCCRRSPRSAPSSCGWGSSRASPAATRRRSSTSRPRGSARRATAPA